MKAVAAGERRVVLVSGEPGIGKTSLSAAFAREAFENGAVVLYGRCDEDLGIPYQPWAEVLAHLVGHAPDDVLAAHVDARGSELARLAPDLARRATVGRASSSDAESERYLLFGAVVDLLARVSASAPVVLVLDDLHWADRPTVQLLRHVVSADAPLRLFVIGTFRDSDVGTDHPLAEALAALHRESGVERLALRGLGDDELLTLLETTAGHAMAEEGVALRDALLAETDGNPFFVGEMLRHLAETRAIYEDEQGRWVASPDLRTSGLPVSIREVIGRRVARLGPPTQRRAVARRGHRPRLRRRRARPGRRARRRRPHRPVRPGRRARRCSPKPTWPGRYTFAHALIEHALYDDLSAGRRARAHRTVAEALEEICGDDPAERIGELAYHWAQRHPAPGRGQGDRVRATGGRSGPRAARARRGAALVPGCARSARTGPPPTTRAVGPRCSSGSATRNDRRVIPRTARPCSRPAASPTTSTRSTSSCAPRCGTTEGGTASSARSTTNASTCSRARSTRLGDADSPDRARLLALLCVERTWDADFDERLSMATQAVDIARRTGDKAALVDAIRLCHESITMPQTLELRRRWNTEACDLADDLGDPTARLHANDYQSLGGAGGGRPRDHEDRVRDLRVGIRADRTTAQPVADRVPPGVASGCSKATSTPPSSRATEALTLGTAAGFPDDAVTFYGGQLIVLRWMQGRLHEMVALIEQVGARQPRTPDLPAPLSHSRRASTTPTTRCDSSSTPRSPTTSRCSPTPPGWPPTCSGPSAVARIGHRPAAMALVSTPVALARPVRDHTHQRSHGGVAHYLGLLAHTLDRHDEADRVVQPGARVPRGDGSAVLRRVDADRVGGPPRRPRPARRRPTGASPGRRRPTRRDRARVRLRRTRRAARCSNGSSSPPTCPWQQSGIGAEAQSSPSPRSLNQVHHLPRRVVAPCRTSRLPGRHPSADLVRPSHQRNSSVSACTTLHARNETR